MTIQQLQQPNTILMIGANDFYAIIKQVLQEQEDKIRSFYEKRNESDQYYTREEAAEILKVHTRTIDAYRRDGLLGPEKKIGNRVLIEREYVDRIDQTKKQSQK